MTTAWILAVCTLFLILVADTLVHFVKASARRVVGMIGVALHLPLVPLLLFAEVSLELLLLIFSFSFLYYLCIGLLAARLEGRGKK